MNKELYFKRRANLKTAIRQAKSLEFKQVWVSKTIEKIQASLGIKNHRT